MSVLKKKELEDSPLADLHAIASELGLEGFRSKRKNDLIAAILEVSGSSAPSEEDEREPDEVPAEEALEAPPVDLQEEELEEEETSEGTSEGTSEDTSEDTSAGTSEDEAEEEPVTAPEREEELAGGILDILANGSGFVRVDPAGQSRDDVYV